MLDMHCQILWGQDDGPCSMEQTLKLMEQAVNEGITAMISTSHCQHPQYDVSFSTVTKQINQLQNELILSNIPLTLYTGHEVRLSEQIVSLIQSNQIHTLANSSYVLIELPTTTVPLYTTHIIHELLRAGITPIIAHPERNKAIVQQPNRLVQLIHEGALCQITAGSLSGHFGRAIQKLSLKLVCANLVHVYGSDVHNLTTRPFHFEAGVRYLEKKKQLNAVDILLENNERILQNSPLIVNEPEQIAETKWWEI